jgi:hypothetical protein
MFNIWRNVRERNFQLCNVSLLSAVNYHWGLWNMKKCKRDAVKCMTQ